jgi:hypothetical protein
MKDSKWRFPGNNFTTDNGLDTADMETFKKDAISSLAREVCQNSIDAKSISKEGPVKVVFKSFIIDKKEVPGHEDILNQIHRCIDTWKSNKKIHNQLNEMLSHLQKKDIYCLRISDFNTTGLIGVNDSKDDKSPWRSLIHGSGISDKGETSGGSKGIGKFATFVNSHFNTVFYNTITEKNEIGFEGICKLCSANMEGTSEKTQGVGYYGSSTRNEPINSLLSLDRSFKRSLNDAGSDLYIIGFKNQKDWEIDIISKILDSFISAIVFETFEFAVNNIVVNNETLRKIIFDSSLISNKYKKSIVSQYLLLTDKVNRIEETITIDGLGTAKLFLMEFNQNNEELATNDCVMIRYPYMKIKDIKKISTLPCSAMCIIENNKLNSILRNTENPQHTDWEFKRIEDESERAEVKSIYSNLLDNIRKIILDHLASSENIKTDIEGAENFIPASDSFFEDQTKDQNRRITDKASIQKTKIKPKFTNPNATIPYENGDGILLDIGVEEDQGTESLKASSNNGYGNKKTDISSKIGKSEEDGNIVKKTADLRGMEYRFFCINKIERKYVVSFTSDFDEPEAFFEIHALDDSAVKYDIKIESCLINGESKFVDNNRIELQLIKGHHYMIEMITNQMNLFSGGVKIYAYR